MPEWVDAGDDDHWASTARAEIEWRGFGRNEGEGTNEQGSPGMEGDALAFHFGCGMTKSKVADCTEAAW